MNRDYQLIRKDSLQQDVSQAAGWLAVVGNYREQGGIRSYWTLGNST